MSCIEDYFKESIKENYTRPSPDSGTLCTYYRSAADSYTAGQKQVPEPDDVQQGLCVWWIFQQQCINAALGNEDGEI